MSNSSSSASGGIGFSGLLGLLFIGLKLMHVINWSWLWVLAPFWLPIVVTLVIALFVLIVALVCAAGGGTFTIKRK